MNSTEIIVFEDGVERIIIEPLESGCAVLRSTIDKGDPEDPDNHFGPAIDGMESLILNCHTEGFDVGCVPFKKAVAATVEAIANELGNQ